MKKQSKLLMILFDRRLMGNVFRRRQDRQIQDRIRQITDRMLRRRLEARSSLFEEKRQVRLELREVKISSSDFLRHSSLLRSVDWNPMLSKPID